MIPKQATSNLDPLALRRYREPASAITHFIGFGLAVAGLVLLIGHAIPQGPLHVVAFTLYGTSLVLLYLASTIYHAVPFQTKAKRVLKKIDHSMIYVLISGTYIPITLVGLGGGWGWSLFGAIIALGAAGIIWKSINSNFSGVFSGLIYLAMGWLIMIAISPLIRELSLNGFWWLLLGGVFYSLGVGFYALDGKFPMLKSPYFGMHEIFHICVLFGSASHYWLIWEYVK